jgi:hypothetical protein
MTQHSVDVFGQRYALHIYQHADNLWIAVGEFLGHPLKTMGRTTLKAVPGRRPPREKRLFVDGQTDGSESETQRRYCRTKST